MIVQMERLQTVLRANGFPNTSLSFGKVIASDLTLEDVKNGRVVLFFPKLDADVEYMTYQQSALVAVEGSLTSYHKDDKDAVALSHSLLAFLGFKRESGDVGRPPRLPQTLASGALQMQYINCPQGVRCVAEPAGKVWAVEQPIEMGFFAP